MIRPIIKEEQQKKSSLREIVDLMSKGAIGAFEIGLVYWVGRLRFSNKAMLTDLVHAGFIDRTRLINSENPASKIDMRLDLLVKHGLIRRVQIQTFESAEEVGKNTEPYFYKKFFFINSIRKYKNFHNQFVFTFVTEILKYS